MYDTSNPYKWRYYKTVEYPFGRWTLTDASLSPDNKYLAYTSIQSAVCLAPTDPNDHGDPYILDLGATGGNPLNMGYRGGNFGIWSIRYSGDGRELVAGCGGGLIVVYDIESRTPLHRILGHDEDVNAVCFADTSSPHILYSGSDDTTLKVWDTRSLGDARAAGVFVGHIEGLTYIDSKGDGRESLHLTSSPFNKNRLHPLQWQRPIYEIMGHQNGNAQCTIRSHQANPSRHEPPLRLPVWGLR